MNNNSLQKFTFSDAAVRVVQGEDGEPRFVAKDIVEGIGAYWTVKATEHIPTEWKGNVSVTSPGGTQQMQCLTEQGVYFYLARSDKPKALPFQKWLAGEVLPSIRKHGMYATAPTVEAMLNDPDTMIKTLQALKEERQARIDAERQLMEDAHKVKTFDALMNVTDDIVDLDTMGKMLKQLGYDTGGKRLRARLRQEGIFCAVGARKNIPKQIYIAQKYFKIIETEYIDRYTGRKNINRTTYVTPKGQEWLIKRFAYRQ